MGANGSYSKAAGGVPKDLRTHSEYDGRLDGHKILVPKANISHGTPPMNSNSANPIYIHGTVDKETGVLTLDTIAIYENHKLVKTIDIDGDSAHMHNWEESSNGNVGRKSRKPSNHHPVPDEYKKLVNDAVNFNKKKNKWKEKS